MGHFLDDLQKSVIESTALDLIKKKRIDFVKAGKISNGQNQRIFPAGTFVERNKTRDRNDSDVNKPIANLKLSVWKSPRVVGSGLANLGNTCYLNSVLQCLTHAPPFAQSLLSDSFKLPEGNNFCVLKIMLLHIKKSIGSSNSSPVIHPKAFLMNLKRIAKHFRIGRQEDSHEFLRHLLDSMQISCLKAKGLKEDSPRAGETLIYQLFGGKLRSQICCTKCKHKSCINEPFLDLSLELSKGISSIQDALRHFTSEETLDQSNQWKCSGCKQFSKARKSLSVQQSPQILILHLKRFSYISGKINRHIHYNDTLDMHSSVNPERAKYKLFGVLVHAGYSTDSGHYYSYVKDPAGNWHEMNDDAVQWVSIKKVLQQQAYILFYVKVSQSTSTIPSSKLKSPAALKRSLEPVDEKDMGIQVKRSKNNKTIDNKEVSQSHHIKKQGNKDSLVNVDKERRHVDKEKSLDALASFVTSWSKIKEKPDLKEQLENSASSAKKNKALGNKEVSQTHHIKKKGNNDCLVNLDKEMTHMDKEKSSDAPTSFLFSSWSEINEEPALEEQLESSASSNDNETKVRFSRELKKRVRVNYGAYCGNLGKLFKHMIIKKRRRSSKQKICLLNTNSSLESVKSFTSSLNLPIVSEKSLLSKEKQNENKEKQNIERRKWDPSQYGGSGLFGKTVCQWNDEDDEPEKQSVSLQSIHNRLLRDLNKKSFQNRNVAKLNQWDAQLDQGRLKKVKGEKQFIRNDGGINSFQNAYSRKEEIIAKSFKKKPPPRKSSNLCPNRRFAKS